MKKVLYSSGIGMWLLAGILTQNFYVLEASVLLLITAAAGYKHAVWDGWRLDGPHLVPLPRDVFEVRDSAGKGMGLFAAVNIPKGSFLMRYDGERINDLEFERRYARDPFSEKASYVLQICDDEFIDGSDENKSGLARYINHATSPKSNLDKYIAHKPGGSCCFFASRDISAGEELFFDYSRSYWEAKGVDPV